MEKNKKNTKNQNDNSNQNSESKDFNRRDMLSIAGGIGLLGGANLASMAFTQQAQGALNSGAEPGRPLKGKVAIVTGARNNMGRAFAVALAQMGANVVIHYHRKATKNQAQETQRLVQKHGVKSALVQGDLGKLKTVEKLYDTAEKKFGGVDIVINNAGAIVKKPLAQFTDEDFDKLTAVNYRGLFYSLREAAKRLRKGGRIINTGTSLLAGAAPGYSVYAGSKAPAEEFSRMLAKELGAKKITVNTIAPGPIDTPFFHGQETPQSAAYAARLSTEKRLGSVADIVPIIEFLSSPVSQWVNGQTIWINGGYLTR